MSRRKSHSKSRRNPRRRRSRRLTLRFNSRRRVRSRRRNPLWRRGYKGKRKGGTFSGRPAKYKLTSFGGSKEHHGWRNPGRRRKSRSRRRSFNGTAKAAFRPLAAITSGFNVNTLGRAGVMVGGALGNAFISGKVSSFLPGMLAKGPGNYAVGLATAGLLGAGVGMVSKNMAGDAFLGAVLEVVTRAAKEYIVPMIPGMSGMGDYLSRENAASARSLGDYLSTVDAAQARGLGDMGEAYIGEELAGY
jgi:hypothetical protein